MSLRVVLLLLLALSISTLTGTLWQEHRPVFIVATILSHALLLAVGLAAALRRRR